MALTIANAHPQYQALTFGGLNARLVDVTFDNSYATAGEAFTPAMVGLSEILAVIDAGKGVMTALTPDGTYLVRYQSEKLWLFNSAGDGDPFDEAGNDDVSTLVVRLLVIGA